jgi:hypothetical protein
MKHTATDRFSILELQLLILEVVFEGDPSAWMRFLVSEGSPEQIRDDLPAVERLMRKRDVMGDNSVH